jgi:hypothetical protein
MRPHCGVVHARGKWSTEGAGRVALYFDKDDFYNGKRLELDPLYTFRPRGLAGASVGYDSGGCGKG